MAETKFLQLEHKLTADELEDYGGKLAKEELALIQVKNEQKETNSDYKDKIKKSTGEILRLSTAIDTGTEFKEVECEVNYDKEKGKKTITDKSTGKSWKEAMTDEDYDLFN